MAKNERICILLLRIIAVGATLSAVIVMAARQVLRNSKCECKYLWRSGSLTLFWRLVVITYMVFTILITSIISAALAVAPVGKRGNSSATWVPVRGQVPKYCDSLEL